jgi:hypothetical protein
MGEIDAHRAATDNGAGACRFRECDCPACLDTSPCGAGTNGFDFQQTDTYRRSRRTLRARFSKSLHPRKSEGAGNAGCALHPRSRVQCAREVRTRAYRAAESIRHSLRNGFTTYSALSLVIGFLATIVPEKLVSQELDASTEASGPHAFVVRVSTPRQRRLRVHRNPPLVRDDGQRPSSRDGMAIDMPPICLL